MGSGPRQIEVAFDCEPMAEQLVKERIGKGYADVQVVEPKLISDEAKGLKLRWAVRVTLSALQGADKATAHVGKICIFLGTPPLTKCAWHDSWEAN